MSGPTRALEVLEAGALSEARGLLHSIALQLDDGGSLGTARLMCQQLTGQIAKAQEARYCQGQLLAARETLGLDA